MVLKAEEKNQIPFQALKKVTLPLNTTDPFLLLQQALNSPQEPENIEKKMTEFYGTYAVDQLMIGMHLENEEKTERINALFQLIKKQEVQPLESSFSEIEHLNQLMEPYLQAESLEKIWEVLLKTGPASLKDSMFKQVFDSEPLVKATQIRKFLFQHQTELQKITTLSLRGKVLRVLPPEIHYFSGLQSLDLSFNRIRKLPVELFTLKFLKNLYLSGNRIIEIPKEFAMLTSLSNAQLDRNFISSLPEEISQLSRLQTLNLAGNHLVKLPSSIGQIPELIYLFVESNHLETLPDSLQGLSNLVGLYLYNNKISLLPESLCQLQNLQVLSVSNNNLKELPADIGNVRTLRSIFLDNNALTGLPVSFSSLVNLIHLSLRGNEIASLPEEMGNLSKLAHFSFDHQLFDTFPKSLTVLPFWSLDPAIYPRCEMRRDSLVLNQSLNNFGEIYWGLGEKKWMECIEGMYHQHGKEVFDKGLHGKVPEDGFLSSMNKGFDFLSAHQNHTIDADFYLKLHNTCCQHFKGESNGTLMGLEKVGVFRNIEDSLVASFAAYYEVDRNGFTEFSDISSKISLMFGTSFRLGDMVVVSENPKKICILYQPMKSEQIRLIFNFFLTEFYYEIGHARHLDERLEAIGRFIQRLEWLHPPRDGCGRTDTALLNALLTTYGFTPVLLNYPYISSCKGIKSWAATLKIGMSKWQQAKNN